MDRLLICETSQSNPTNTRHPLQMELARMIEERSNATIASARRIHMSFLTFASKTIIMKTASVQGQEHGRASSLTEFLPNQLNFGETCILLAFAMQLPMFKPSFLQRSTQQLKSWLSRFVTMTNHVHPSCLIVEPIHRSGAMVVLVPHDPSMTVWLHHHGLVASHRSIQA